MGPFFVVEVHGLVDEHYVMYSVFDYESPENPAANAVFFELTTVDIEDDALCGSFLVIRMV